MFAATRFRSGTALLVPLKIIKRLAAVQGQAYSRYSYMYERHACCSPVTRGFRLCGFYSIILIHIQDFCRIQIPVNGFFVMLASFAVESLIILVISYTHN